MYGNEPTIPKDENSITKPISPYGYEKLIGEQYSKNFYNELYGVETVCLYILMYMIQDNLLQVIIVELFLF